MRALTDLKTSVVKWLDRLALPPPEDGEMEMLSYSASAFNKNRESRNIRRRLRPTKEQSAILTLLALQMVVIVIVYQFSLTRILLYPFALLATVFHEFGHAFMCVMTGGRVNQIQIEMNEAGLTRFQGGWVCAILPAGYIGSTLIGSLLLFLAFGYKTARGTGWGVLAILVITFFHAGDIFTYVATLTLFAIILGAIIYRGGAFARHFILFLGAIASVESILAILNGTLLHTIEGSDAYVFSRQCSMVIPAFIYGLLWLIISILLIALALISAVLFFRRR